MTGDPVERCLWCGLTYYVVNGHNCSHKSSWGGTWYHTKTTEWSTNGAYGFDVIGSWVLPVGWECPRCRKINAPAVPECDCKFIGTLEPVNPSP